MNKKIAFYSKNYDLIIGGLTRDQANSSQFIPTAVYFQGDITLCVKRAQPFPQWTNVFFKIKDFQTWAAGLTLFIWGIVLLYIMTMFEPKPMDAWKTIVFSIQTMLGVPSTFKPKGSIIRVLYFATLYVQLLVVTLYNAYFISFITRRIGGKQISTIDEVIQKNLRVHSDRRTIDLLNEYGIGSRFGDLNSCENMDSCLNRLQYNENMAVVVSRIFFDTSNHSNVYCFDRSQVLLSHSIVFMIQQENAMCNEFIEVFNRLIRSGLIAKWIKDRHIHNFLPTDENPPYESIKLYQALGPFAVCSPILLLAFLAAIAEQIISWQLLKNRKSRFWRLADRFVDGQRHYVLLSDKKKKIVPRKKLLKISKKLQRNRQNESHLGTITVRYERIIISGDAVATATLLGEIE